MTTTKRLDLRVLLCFILATYSDGRPTGREKLSHMLMQLKKYARQKAPRCQKRTAVWLKMVLAVFVVAACGMTALWDHVFLASRGDISCFHALGNVLDELSDEEPVRGMAIFFHETSCHKNCSDVRLNPRQACSVESALKAHPERDVFLLVSSPVLVPLVNSRNTLIRTLVKYPNFKVRHISFSKYLTDTPLAVIDRVGALNTSRWPVSHASDVLRYATLYKFGGIYLDLDVMVFKSLSKLINFAGAESEVSIGSGILGFGSDEVGRQVATACANELARTFNGDIWGFNGPGVITRVLERRCNTKSIAEMSRGTCVGFDVHPMESFTAISFREPELFFVEDKNDNIQKLLNNSYTVHFWNKFSSQFLIKNRWKVPFVTYAKIYCPRITNVVDGYF